MQYVFTCPSIAPAAACPQQVIHAPFEQASVPNRRHWLPASQVGGVRVACGAEVLTGLNGAAQPAESLHHVRCAPARHPSCHLPFAGHPSPIQRAKVTPLAACLSL